MTQRIAIKIKPSTSSVPGYWDLEIDSGGWDLGLDGEQIEMAVTQFVRSTISLLEIERDTMRTG